MPIARTIPLLALLVPTLPGCAPEEEVWPVCAEEEELTAADYGGYGEGLPDWDFLVCGPLPADGSACPDRHDVDGNALFEENIGPASDERCEYRFEVDCGPETTITDRCCYVLDWDGARHC